MARGVPLDPAKIEKMRELRSHGVSVRDIAKRLGVVSSTVSTYTRDLTPTPRPQEVSPPTPTAAVPPVGARPGPLAEAIATKQDLLRSKSLDRAIADLSEPPTPASNSGEVLELRQRVRDLESELRKSAEATLNARFEGLERVITELKVDLNKPTPPSSTPPVKDHHIDFLESEIKATREEVVRLRESRSTPPTDPSKDHHVAHLENELSEIKREADRLREARISGLERSLSELKSQPRSDNELIEGMKQLGQIIERSQVHLGGSLEKVFLALGQAPPKQLAEGAAGGDFASIVEKRYPEYVRES